MAQPTANYKGEHITCYPGSNQTDNGKLNLEYNMARIVTRVTSKNFCIIKPSFDIEAITNIETGAPQLRITPGQCSINGMDLIMTAALTIDAPEKPGTYHLAFSLARDSSWNVLGDLVYGSSTTFKGLYLTYFDDKPDPVDPDMLYLGKVTWTGSEFIDIIEDEDKYGRIWAEDILCKINDPKHPDTSRLNLQEWLDKVPDWFVSKEGDNEYGQIIFMSNRQKPNPGIFINVDESGSHLTIKDPTKDNGTKLQLYGDINRDGKVDMTDYNLVKEFVNKTKTPTALQKILADVNHDGVIDEKDLEYILNYINEEGNPGDTGNIYYVDSNDRDFNVDVTGGKVLVEVGQADIYQSESDGILYITNPKDIRIDSEGNINVEAENRITMSTENSSSPVLTLDNDKFSITDPTAPNLSFAVQVTDGNTLQQTLGKAIWQYTTLSGVNYVKLLSTNVNYLDIVPNSDFEGNIRARNTIYIGSEGTYGNEKTYLKATDWKIANSANTIFTQFAPSTITAVSATADGSYILLKNANSNETTSSKLLNSGKLELLNNTSTGYPSIVFRDGTSSRDVTLYKIRGEKRLNIDGSLSIGENLLVTGYVQGNGGLITGNGTITFVRGSNNATITKDNGSTNLRTSGALYIGASGTSPLYAGNTTINGTMSVSGKLSGTGDWETTGTIRGSKVYNAVYNDTVEFMEKEDYDEVIEAGDVVYFTDNGKVTKFNPNVNIKALAGIVSSEETYGYALGGEGLDDNQKVPIALTGRVYLKVDMNVRTGDLLGISPNGIVVIVNDIDRFTIGKATRPSENGIVYVKVIN